MVLAHRASAGVSAYAIDPVVPNGGFYVRYDGPVGVTLIGEPQLLALNLMRSDVPTALIGQYLVDTLPQSDLLLVEEHFVASSGRHAPPLVAVAAVEPGDILGVTHASLISVLLDSLKYDHRAPTPPPPGLLRCMWSPPFRPHHSQQRKLRPRPRLSCLSI